MPRPVYRIHTVHRQIELGDISTPRNTPDTRFFNYTPTIKGHDSYERCAQPSAFTRETSYLPGEANWGDLKCRQPFVGRGSAQRSPRPHSWYARGLLSLSKNPIPDLGQSDLNMSLRNFSLAPRFHFFYKKNSLIKRHFSYVHSACIMCLNACSE